MIVRLDNVSKRYDRRWALVRVSLTLPARQTVLLTGANGAGKTTLLSVLSTALHPTRGALELFGLPAHDNLDAVRARLGLVTHRSHLYEDLSAQENLELAARLQGISTGEIRGLLERVGLATRAKSAVRTFSAGMTRRLCLARVLLRRPELVLLDEPFAQLDPEGQTLVEEIIKELRARQATLVISTHDIDRVRPLCDLNLHLEQGRVVRNLEPITVAPRHEVAE